MVYDIASLNSFHGAMRILQRFITLAYTNVIFMLVGNKCDLEDYRKMPTEAAKEYAKENSVMFIETSAKDGTNVEEAFLNLVIST